MNSLISYSYYLIIWKLDKIVIFCLGLSLNFEEGLDIFSRLELPWIYDCFLFFYATYLQVLIGLIFFYINLLVIEQDCIVVYYNTLVVHPKIFFHWSFNEENGDLSYTLIFWKPFFLINLLILWIIERIILE